MTILTTTIAVISEQTIQELEQVSWDTQLGESHDQFILGDVVGEEVLAKLDHRLAPDAFSTASMMGPKRVSKTVCSTVC